MEETPKEIKWTVIIAAQSSPEIFIRCISKLVVSIDPSRTEIVLVYNVKNTFILEAFKYYCGEAIVHQVVTTDFDHITSMWNLGAETALGDHFVFLSDRTIVTDNIIVKLAHVFDTFQRDYKMGPIGIVAPLIGKALSNINVTPENLDQVQINIDKQPKNKKPCSLALGVGKACLFTSKSIYQSLGGFSSVLDEGFTAIDDFVVRLLDRGLLPVIAADTIVYHELLEEKDNPLLLYKMHRKTDSKLAVAYRVKINTEYTLGVFIQSLQQSTQFTDGIFILDDNSKIRVSSSIKEQYPELWSKVSHSIKYSRAFDEKRDLNELYTRAREFGYQWIMFLDADEVIEDRFDLDFKNKLINPVNPLILGYVLHSYFLWGDDDHWRVDHQWGQARDVRLMRILPDREITMPGKIAAEFGYGPTIPPESIRDCGIRIKNYGFMLPEERIPRRDFLDHLDVKLRGMDRNGWEYLTDENRMTRYPWVNSSLSIYTPIRTGGSYLCEWLDICSYFADEIVFGDNGISDNDREIASMYNVKIVPTEMGDNFSIPRNTCLRVCTKEQILQLDLDERIDDWASLRRMMDTKKIDCWSIGINNFQRNGESITTETIRLFKNDGKVEYWGYLHETIDNYAQSCGWLIGKTPMCISHYGYLKSTQKELFIKMQRYMHINMKQIEDFPMDGRAYFNLAIHLLEDNCVDDAMRLLLISNHLAKNFVLVPLELGKTYLLKAYFWFQRASKLVGKDANAPFIQRFLQVLKPILPQNIPTAPGHCLSFFNKSPDRAEWLRKHIEDMEHKIENVMVKRLEKQ